MPGTGSELQFNIRYCYIIIHLISFRDVIGIEFYELSVNTVIHYFGVDLGNILVSRYIKKRGR